MKSLKRRFAGISERTAPARAASGDSAWDWRHMREDRADRGIRRHTGGRHQVSVDACR